MFRLTPFKPHLSERDVIARCEAVLRRRGYWLHRNPVGRFRTKSDSWVDFGPEGIPDYTAIHSTFPAFFIEFKAPGKKLRPEQETQFERIQFGFKLAAVMVDSVESLSDWLAGHERRARGRGS